MTQVAVLVVSALCALWAAPRGVSGAAVTGAACTIPFCDSCANEDLVCDVCPDDKVLSIDRRTCLDCPADCTTCIPTVDDATECETCDEGFRLDTSKNCEVCGSNCKKCDTEGTTKCDEGACKSTTGGVGTIWHSETKTCRNCANWCISCSAAGKCDEGQCFAGYTRLSTETCSECGANCESCDTNGRGLCDSGRCDAGYVYDAVTKTCSACPADCLECSDASTCTRCDTGFGIRNSDNRCYACSTNCADCAINGEGKCDVGKCNQGYVRDSDNKCQACGSNCEACDTNGAGKCDVDSCEDYFGYKASDKSCVSCGDVNCKKCSVSDEGTITCTQCRDKFQTTTGNTCDGN